MHGEEDSEWGRYAAACVRDIPADLIRRNADMQNTAVREANKKLRVFTGPTGGSQLRWTWRNGALEPAVLTNTGWREETDGNRTQVWYYQGWGWMTPDERFNLRQSDPRIAP